MEHFNNHLKVINGVQEQEKRASPSSKRKRVALALVVAAVLVGLVNWLVATNGSSPSIAAQASAPVKPAPVSAAAGPSMESEYYPGKFRNQAQRSEPEEHIQAF